MTFRVTITPQARGDIDRNSDWWAVHHSVDQALKWSDAIYDQIESLAEFPESHALSVENDDFPYEIRDKLVGLGDAAATGRSSQFKRTGCWFSLCERSRKIDWHRTMSNLMLMLSSSGDLTARFGRGFTWKNLYRTADFAFSLSWRR